ncbi:NAD(P)/FAD-dependent oxidoreductase [Haloarchaeobius sp. HME9146]|uniref:NAD(P)/FAD-dependent oxidoreductase n=1 Tax=Haloarchaeobius sp. HME9146 TaxID=2978732 RepID=UPI0021C1F26E|nr:NAD(P)/FAD-dependent oxidoreductase [Haloarchaeobius sp. HME9146]MCT9097688.1 NAD(P)/FAD-dependent oxidoreductase [Haloarchaeobius sp. HME9146]
MTVGIVGGGVAGLAAAYRLQQAGYEAQVFEASEDIGGLAAVYETAGQPIEKFYHHLSKSEETIVELAEELGVGDRLEWPYKSDAYYVDGVVHPMDKAWEIAAYPHLSFYDKFRLGMLTMEIDLRGGVPSFDTYERLEDFEHVPIKEFVVEHTTKNVYESFFEPLLDAKFGSRKEDVSAAWLLGRIKFRGERDLLKGEQLGYFDGSFSVLIDALVDAVGRENVTTGARVTEVDTSGEQVSTLTVETDDGTETHDVDSVVVAAMPNVLEDLTGYACDIDFQGTVCSVWSMDESITDTYWLNIKDEAPFGVLIEHTNFISEERYGGEHLYYTASYVQDPSEDLWQMSDEEVEEYWQEGIQDLFPHFDPEMVNWVQTARNPRTAPVYERGYLDMVIPYDLADEVASGVYYAGMASRAQYPERSLNGAIVAGYECADRIAGAGARTEQEQERASDEQASLAE